MTGYEEITTQADIDRLLGRVARFHDSLTKEFRVINRRHVRPDHSMLGWSRFDGQLLVQSQWPPFAVEMVFSNILELHATGCGEQWSACGKFLSVGRQVDTAVEFNFDNQLRVVAERVFHADRTEWLGERTFLGPELPSVDAVQAVAVGGRWRQCSGCWDAWEEDDRIRWSRCPTCGRLTDLPPPP